MSESVTIYATFSAKEYRERRKGKNSRPPVVPIHPEALDFLAERKQSALPETFVFVNRRTGKAYTKSSIRHL